MLHQNAFWAFLQGVCVAIWFIESITAVRGLVYRTCCKQRDRRLRMGFMTGGPSFLCKACVKIHFDSVLAGFLNPVSFSLAVRMVPEQ